jgi:CRP/FNR family nitrogen fixation transcriptional regulator
MRNRCSVEVTDPCRKTQLNSARDDLPGVLESLAVFKWCRHGQGIYGQEEPAEYWYRVVSGLLRRFAVGHDGRRQIMDFLLPGDFFGFAGGDEYHHCSAEAVATGTVVACYPRRCVEMLADSHPEVGHLIRQKAFGAATRLQGQIRILGRTRASEKVDAFLLDMAARAAYGSRDELVLPMSRYDIADYLALSVETVSRAITDLKQRGAIALAGARRVTIFDREAFRERSSDDFPATAQADAVVDVANYSGSEPPDAALPIARSHSLVTTSTTPMSTSPRA